MPDEEPQKQKKKKNAITSLRLGLRQVIGLDQTETMPDFTEQAIPVRVVWARRMARLRKRMSSWLKAIFHTLLGNILGLVGVGLVLAVILWPLMGLLLYGEPTPLIPRGDPARNTALTVVLTVVAGVGGAIALAISYRKQKQAEATNFLERLGTAAGQLGASSAAVQFAGIHALAALADEALIPSQQQQCSDVLCSYMRLPYDESTQRTTLTGVVTKRTWLSSTGSYDVTRTYEHRPAEIRVGQTIMQVIADHFRARAATSWSHLKLDLSECVIPFADFASLNLGTANFKGVRFTEGADFSHSNFRAATTFAGARFTGLADFTDVRFYESTDFSESRAADNIRFDKALFGGEADFVKSTFCKLASFRSVSFRGTVWFQGSLFMGMAVFDSVAFDRYATFGNEPHYANRYRREPAVFQSSVSFARSAFRSESNFLRVTFSGAPGDFTDTRFAHPPQGIELDD